MVAPRTSIEAISLRRMLRELDRFDSALSLELLARCLKSWRPSRGELRPFLRFDDRGYCRNLVRRGPAYEALLLCWRPDQVSPIHDHSGSACAFRVLEGIGSETSFVECGRWVRPVHSARHEIGDVCVSSDEGIHELGNWQASNLVTLHLYSPPLVAPRLFERVPASSGVTVA
jgi:cysteine dioxygenase